MKQPVIKIAKPGRSLFSKDIGDFLLYTKYNAFKIFMTVEGETTFTDWGQVNKYEYRHGLGYKPMALGYYTGAYTIGENTTLDDDLWYPMNSKERGYIQPNAVACGFVYNKESESSTPSAGAGDNEDTDFITVVHYHCETDPGVGYQHLPVTSKYKLFIFADPDVGAWY